jgi:hypothetical protein
LRNKCVEAGLSSAKNSINVAVKNLADLVIAVGFAVVADIVSCLEDS